jgi:hypothetical protein
MLKRRYTIFCIMIMPDIILEIRHDLFENESTKPIDMSAIKASGLLSRKRMSLALPNAELRAERPSSLLARQAFKDEVAD